MFEVNASGLGVGGSETGTFDARSHAPTLHPVLFRNGKVIDIGTLPGGSEGFAFSVNNHGQALGVSSTGLPGPTFPDFFDWGGRVHGFVWHHGRMRDIGTLGGPGAVPGRINERGQVSGDSYVDDVVNASTGFPTTHLFLWQNGRMRDLGSFGGSTSFSFWMNQRGQVVGRATLAGDTITHPFFWDGRRLHDLGTLGGDLAEASRINDRGVIAGGSYTRGNTTFHTVIWRHGVMTDLSPGADQCTFPEWINNRDDIVGGPCGGRTALLWRDGVQYDLNALVEDTEVHLTTGSYIDDHGRIVALGALPNGDQHVFLLERQRDR